MRRNLSALTTFNETACIKCNAVSTTWRPLICWKWIRGHIINFCLQALDLASTVGIFRDPKHRVDASEMSDLHRTVGIFIATITIGRRRSVLEERRDHGAIEPRSHHDRIAIERRSCSFSGGIAPRRPADNRRSTTTIIRARSWLDRGPIAPKFMPLFEAKIEALSLRIWSHKAMH